MPTGKQDRHEQHTEVARRYFNEGRETGRVEGRLAEARELVLALADRHGRVADHLRGRVRACDAPELLRSLALDLADAADLDSVEALIARVPLSRVVEG